MKQILSLVAAFLVLTSVHVFAQSASAPNSSLEFQIASPVTPISTDTNALKRQVVRELFIRTHVRDNAQLVVHGMMTQLRKNLSTNERATDKIDQFDSRMDSILGILLDSITPVYYKYYSLEDLKALNRVYDLPVMQYALKIMPSLITEMQAISARVGTNIMTHIVEASKAVDDDEDTSVSVDATPATSAPPPAPVGAASLINHKHK